MNSPRPSVMAVISLKASLFITQAHFQRTAVYCVFSVLRVIRWHVCTLRTADRRETVCSFYLSMILKLFTKLKMAWRRSKHVELLNKTELVVFRHISNLCIHFNIILPSMTTSSKWSLSISFRTKFQWIFLLSLLDLITQISGQQFNYAAPLYAVFSSLLSLIRFNSKHFPQRPFLEHPRPIFLPVCETLNDSGQFVLSEIVH